MTDIQPVYGIPALMVDYSLVIGDLHIGLESHLRKKGFHLVSHTRDMIGAVLEAAGDEANRLIVIGDVKDSVPGSTKQEYAEIPDFFEELFDRFDMIDVVRGNHDTGIEEFLPGKVKIRPATGLKVGDVGFAHGHTWPSEEVMSAKTLVMAHNHPAVMFRDGVGRQTTEPCWFRGRFSESSSDRYPVLPEGFVVVPAFNRMLGGSPVNTIGDELLGPVLNSGLLDLDNAHIYLLDGLDLGRRADLMIDGRRTGKWKDTKRDPQRRAKYS
ncbi:MAG: metallophosphoesterase [Thermoplasmata archaeon]|nr:metallophosphoesterase [Thermoplasmata archaeon]